MVNAFQAVADLGPFVPDSQQALTYYDSQQLFLMGQAAMWFGGSWDIPLFESEEPDFEWGVFGIPAPEGQDQRYVTFHLDAGMGVNAASVYKEAAKTFLEWMTTPEFAKLLANELPGFFPISNNPPAPDNPHAAEFLALNEGAGLAQPNMGMGAAVATVMFLILLVGVTAWLLSTQRRTTEL